MLEAVEILKGVCCSRVYEWCWTQLHSSGIGV